MSSKRNWLLLAGFLILNAIFNARFQLHYDEAYYWTWGQNLSLSYYDHPPVIAYLIRLFGIFGKNEFWVRFPALLTSAIAIYTLFKLSKRMFGKEVASIALILLLAYPDLQGSLFIVTPDSPLLMFWAITLYCFYVGIFENITKYIYLAGIAAGLALLSKYTAVVLFPGLFLFLLTSKQYRYYLLKKDIYLAFILSWIMFIPVIIWNYQHQWVSFVYQFNHAMKVDHIIQLRFLTDYLGEQVLICGPILFFAIMFFTLKYVKLNFRQDKLAFLMWPFVFGMVFFGYRSLFQHLEANWSAPIYLSAILILAYWLNYTGNKWIYRSALVFIIIVIVVLKLPLSFVPKRMHNHVPTMDAFFGNKEVLEEVKPYLKPDTILLACDYANASRAWFYLNLKRVYVLKNFPYSNMYQYWNNQLPRPIKQAIYICDSDNLSDLDDLKKDFSQVNLIKVVKYSDIISDKQIYIYNAQN